MIALRPGIGHHDKIVDFLLPSSPLPGKEHTTTGREAERKALQVGPGLRQWLKEGEGSIIYVLLILDYRQKYVGNLEDFNNNIESQVEYVTSRGGENRPGSGNWEDQVFPFY